MRLWTSFKWFRTASLRQDGKQVLSSIQQKIFRTVTDKILSRRTPLCGVNNKNNKNNNNNNNNQFNAYLLTLRLLMSYIYGAPSKARNANVVYIWTYVWQR